MVTTRIFNSSVVEAATTAYAVAKNQKLGIAGTSAVGNTDSYANALLLIESRFLRTRNGGRPGQVSGYIANRLWSNCLVFDPGFVLLDAARNDAGLALPNVINMVSEIRKTGAIVLLANNWGYPINAGNSVGIAAVNAYNAALKAQFPPANGTDGPTTADPGIIYLDIFSQLFNSDGSPKYPLVQTTATGAANTAGNTVINVASGSSFTVGHFVFSADGNISTPCAVIATTSTTITLSRGIAGTITAGTIIYDQQYFKDDTHPSGSGSILLATYVQTVVNAAGLLSGQKPRAPMNTVTAAEQTAGATENYFGQMATMEGTPAGGLHPGIISHFTSPNVAVISDAAFRGGKAQRCYAPSPTTGAQVMLLTDGSAMPDFKNLAGRKVGFHMKYRAVGWQNAGVMYNINLQAGNPGGSSTHYQQFPTSFALDYPIPFSSNLVNFDGLFEVWGVSYLPPDFSDGGISLEIKNIIDIPSGVTPPYIDIGELGFWDIDDPQLPRRNAKRSRTVTTTGTLLSTDETIKINSASTTTQTLPTTGNLVDTQEIRLVNIGAGTVTVTDGLTNILTVITGATKVFVLDLSGTPVWRS